MSKEQRSELVDRSNTTEPTEKDREAFVNYLSEHPDAWKRIGDVSGIVREQLLRSIGNGVLIETTRHSLRDLKEQFGFATAPALERLLIENILNCWLHYQLAEHGYTKHVTASSLPGQGMYWEKRLTAAQRRYLKAIETLAKVRKMNLPAIQVNIAQQQINSL